MVLPWGIHVISVQGWCFMAWSERVSDDQAARRAGARRRLNARRQGEAWLLRRQVLLLSHQYGLGYGVQARIARELGISEATVSRHLAYWQRNRRLTEQRMARAWQRCEKWARRLGK
jgi:DNA-binding transcriptional ArsR family regulator